MITREKLKTDAKNVLSSTYWLSLASHFIVSTAISAITSVVVVVIYILAIVLQMAIAVPVALISQDETAAVLAALLSPGGLIIFGAVMALTVCVSFPAQVGLHYFYIKSRNTLKPDIGDIFVPVRTNYKSGTISLSRLPYFSKKQSTASRWISTRLRKTSRIVASSTRLTASTSRKWLPPLISS